MRTPVLIIAIASLVGCSSLAPTNDPVNLRITDIDARLMRVERVLENESLIALAGDIASLREEMRSLLGEVETLRYELENQGQRQQTLYVDLDRRLAVLEEAQSRTAAMSPAATGGSAAAASDQQAYDAAFGRVQQQDWEGAQAAFESFLADYPASPLGSNAQYWLAETLYAQLDFDAALGEFQRVLDDYPQSTKLPDAMLKVGFSQYALGDLDSARQTLRRVAREFPGTTVANEAEQRLQRIAEEAG